MIAIDHKITLPRKGISKGAMRSHKSNTPAPQRLIAIAPPSPKPRSSLVRHIFQLKVLHQYQTGPLQIYLDKNLCL